MFIASTPIASSAVPLMPVAKASFELVSPQVPKAVVPTNDVPVPLRVEPGACPRTPAPPGENDTPEIPMPEPEVGSEYPKTPPPDAELPFDPITPQLVPVVAVS